MCPHISQGCLAASRIPMRIYPHIYVFILLYVSAYCHLCPHTGMCPHTTTEREQEKETSRF